MITKRVEIGHIGILPDGQMQIREDTVIEEDGKELGRTYFRQVLAPGDDISKIKDVRIVRIAQLLWTMDKK